MQDFTLTPKTMERCEHVKKCICLTLAEIHRWYSPLQDRSIAEYLKSINQSWRCRVFQNVPVDIHTPLTTDPRDYDCETLFRMVKYLDHFSPGGDPAWTEMDTDSFEGLVAFVHAESGELKEAWGLTNQRLTMKLDKIQEKLLMIISKIEDDKGVKLFDLTKEVLKEFDNVPMTLLTHMDMFSVQHSVHRLFVMVYKQLNCLEGNTIEQYCQQNFNIRKPLTAFTAREKQILKCNIPPENMPIRLLFKLIERVCGLKKRADREWTSVSESLESRLTQVKQLHQKLVCGTPTDNWQTELLQLFEQVLAKVCEKNGKSIREVMEKMPEEPLDLDSLAPLVKLLSKDDSVDINESACGQEDTPSLSPTPEAADAAQSTAPPIHSLTQEEMNIACIFQALCPGGPAARVMIQVFTSHQGDVQKSIADKKKSWLNADEVKTLSVAGGPKMETLDITLLYKLVRSGCQGLAGINDPVWQDSTSDSIEYYLYLIKKERNALAHEKSKLSKLEVKVNMRRIKRILTNIMLHIPTCSSTFVDEIKNEMRRLQIAPFDFTAYVENVKKMKDQLCHTVQKEAVKELCERYKKPEVVMASPITWQLHDNQQQLTIDKLFTEPEIVSHSNTDIPKKQKYINLSSLLIENLNNCHKVIMHGVAGCGKTSVCQNILHTWSNTIGDCQENSHLMLFIKCKGMKQDNLRDFLTAYLPNTFRQVDNDDIISLITDLQCIFIVDGYDDASYEAKQLLQDILTIMPMSGIFITTKPHLISALQMEVHQITGRKCEVIKNKGFTKVKREEFVNRFFETALTQGSADPNVQVKVKTQASEMLSYLDGLDKRHQVFVSLPLTLSLLVVLWLDDSKNAREAKTLTRIYHQINKCIIKRFKLQESDEEEWMQVLSEAAWNSLKKGSLCLSGKYEKRLLKIGNSVGLKDQALATFLRRSQDNLTLSGTNNWEFTHNSQQEFLAAVYLSNKILDDDSNKLSHYLSEDILNKQHSPCAYLQVLEFVAGLLAMEDELESDCFNDIVSMISIQTPWGFEVLRRMVGDITQERAELEHSITKVFRGVNLLDKLENFDPEDIHWVIQRTAVNVPPRVWLCNPVSDIVKMGPLLTTMKERQCITHVIVSVDTISDANNIVQITCPAPEVEYVLKVRNATALPTLINNWNFSNPLHMTFPHRLLPLFWWELKLALTTSGKNNLTVAINKKAEFLSNFHEGVEQLTIITNHEASSIVQISYCDN